MEVWKTLIYSFLFCVGTYFYFYLFFFFFPCFALWCEVSLSTLRFTIQQKIHTKRPSTKHPVT